MNEKVIIDETTCRNCMVCTEICPNRIMRKNESGRAEVRKERASLCFSCGQCMSACSSYSVKVDGLSYEKDMFNVSVPAESEEIFNSIIQSRRSVRNFKDKPVPADVLEKIVDAVSYAPPAFPPVKYSLMVVSDRELLKKALPLMIEMYEKLVKMMKNPFIRYFIKKEVGKKRFKTMDEHLVSILESDIPLMKNEGEDTLMRNAPAMLLFLEDRDSEDINADIYIAVTIGTLAAHSYGLGSTITDIIPPAIQRNPDLRKLFRIPEDKNVVAALIIGYPKYRYHRGIKRKIKSVEWI